MTYHQHFNIFILIIKDLIYIDLLEAYQPQGISTNIHSIWSFEHFSLKNAKVFQSFLWCIPIYSLVLFWMLFSHLCSPFVMYVWDTWKGIFKKFLIHRALCPFLPYFPHVHKIQCWKNLSYHFSSPGTTFKDTADTEMVYRWTKKSSKPVGEH